MSTVDSPVTQIVDTAVKTVSARGAGLPLDVPAGSESSAVKTSTSDANTSTANRAGEDVVRLRNRSKVRPSPDRDMSGPLGRPSYALPRLLVPVPRLPSDMRVLSSAAPSAERDHGTPPGGRLI